MNSHKKSIEFASLIGICKTAVVLMLPFWALIVLLMVTNIVIYLSHLAALYFYSVTSNQAQKVVYSKSLVKWFNG